MAHGHRLNIFESLTNNEVGADTRTEAKVDDIKNSSLTEHITTTQNINPIFELIGASTWGGELNRRNMRGSYAESVGRQQTRLPRDLLLDLNFRNVITRGRVQESLYNISEEVERTNDLMPENFYLTIMNNLRTINDYISQNDIGTPAPPSTPNIQSIAPRLVRQIGTYYSPEPNVPDPNLPEPNSFLESLIINFTLPQPSDLHINNGIIGSSPLVMSLYYIFKWLIKEAPLHNIWLTFIIIIWAGIFLIFLALVDIIRIPIFIKRYILRKFMIFWCLLIEEIHIDRDLPLSSLIIGTARYCRNLINDVPVNSGS